MFIDIYTHFFPNTFFERMGQIAPRLENIGKRMQAVKGVHDLDVRFRAMDPFGDYRQSDNGRENIALLVARPPRRGRHRGRGFTERWYRPGVTAKRPRRWRQLCGAAEHPVRWAKQPCGLP